MEEQKVIRVNLDAVAEQTKYHSNYLQLPGCDYYNRQTEAPSDTALNTLIKRSQEKLKPMIHELWPELTLTNEEALQKKIKEMKAEKKAATEGTPGYQLAVQKLNILEDFNKVSKLTAMKIPQQDKEPLPYCTLAEATSGVTKKVALIERNKVDMQLNKLINSDVTTFEQYTKQRDQYKLSTNAILKLPKAGKITEVQREAMALNMSRMLGLETTKSTMLNHQGVPALFVPFDTIHLLKDVATGVEMQSRLFSTAKYSHYSTINPVGAGVEAEHFVEDFGNSLGLFYLCSDTDAIGGYNQNKALKGNSLYIFDQVIMEANKLKLDSRLSMQPIETISMHTRHGQGRNRTLIEDSSMNRKFDSLMKLKQEQTKLVHYCKYVSDTHKIQIDALKTKIKSSPTAKETTELKKQLKNVQALKKDADILQKTIEKRINEINNILKIMPESIQNIEPKLVNQVFILEKLLNRPRLFAEDGRPYRNPWTYRNTNNALEISPVPEKPDEFKIKFKEDIPNDVIHMLNRKSGASSPIISAKKELVITKEQLLALKETSLFPESEIHLDTKQNYLDPEDLNVIKQGYKKGNSDLIISVITDYVNSTYPSDISHEVQLQDMDKIEKQLKEYIATAKEDKGFAKHVLKKFQLDTQQKLQKMILCDEEHKCLINDAFHAALKLDQVGQFNVVMQEAIKQKKSTDPVFIKFLEECILKAAKAEDHFKAMKQSEDLNALAITTITNIKTIDLVAAEGDNDILRDVRPREAQAMGLDKIKNIFVEAIAEGEAKKRGAPANEGGVPSITA